jgi:MoxR-like ATPase
MTGSPAFQLNAPEGPRPTLPFKSPDAGLRSLTERRRPRALSEMVGQGEAVWQLLSFLEAPYATAFLFEGPTGVGKTTAALAVAAELGAVEDSLRSLHFTPMLGSGWKVVIVDEADFMSPKAAHLWLSALEDLPPRSVVIFTTNSSTKFPDRFLDRCQRIRFEADAVTHARDAQCLIDHVWAEETGRREAPAPKLESLKGAVDPCGQLSYRRVIRMLEPLIAASRAGRQATSQPEGPRPRKLTAASPELAACRRAAALKAVATRKARSLSLQVRVQTQTEGV